jgi:hypothetical protein
MIPKLGMVVSFVYAYSSHIPIHPQTFGSIPFLGFAAVPSRICRHVPNDRALDILIFSVSFLSSVSFFSLGWSGRVGIFCSRFTMFIPSTSLLAIRATQITADNKSTAITITSWLLMFIFIIIFILRETIKFVVLRRFALDDLLILLAVVCSSRPLQRTSLTIADIRYWVLSNSSHTCIGRIGRVWKTSESTRERHHERILRLRFSLHIVHRFRETFPHHVLPHYLCAANRTSRSSRTWNLHQCLDFSLATRGSLSMWPSATVGNTDPALLQ